MDTRAAADIKTVSWELALDSDFSRIVQSGSTETSQARDHIVKTLAENLHPGQSYYYRFRVDDVVSEPGRTCTLPEVSLARLGIAVAVLFELLVWLLQRIRSHCSRSGHRLRSTSGRLHL